MQNSNYNAVLKKIKKINFYSDENFQKLLDDPASIPAVKQFLATTEKEGDNLRFFLSCLGNKYDIPKLKEEMRYSSFMTLSGIYERVIIVVLVVSFIIEWLWESFGDALGLVVIFGIPLYILGRRFTTVSTNDFYFRDKKCELLEDLNKRIKKTSYENSFEE